MVKPWAGWALLLGFAALHIVTRYTSFLDGVERLRMATPLTSTIGLGLIVVVLGLFVLVARGRRWVTAVLVVATFAPYLPFHTAWGSMAGPLAAALALTFSGRLRWVLFTAAVLGDVLAAAVAGGLEAQVSEAIIDVNMGLALFVLARLAVMLGQTHAANLELAELEMAGERLRAAADLRQALGVPLSRLLQLSRRHVLTTDLLSDIAEVSRKAAAVARTVTDVRREHLPAVRLDLPDESRRVGQWGMAMMAVIYSLISLTNLSAADGADKWDWAVALVVAPLAVALQLYHGFPRAGEPRFWRWTVPLHIVITGAAAFYEGGGNIHPMLTLALANVVLWLPARWSVPILVAGAVGKGWLVGLAVGSGLYQIYTTVTCIVAAIAVFAFNRLPEVAARLRDLRQQLATTAVVTERLRVARDVHDLLGFTLSAITLKAELALRVIDHDPAKATRLLEEVPVLAVRAISEVRSVTAKGAELSLSEEIDSAQELLTSAGVSARVDAVAVGDSPVLALVLREAATNVIRHSAARLCTITIESQDRRVRLRITNDGVTSANSGTGSGLSNLAARVRATGGTFTAGDQGDETFTLVASVPR